MALFPGWQAPDFTIDTTTGPIRFHAWGQGCWRIVMTHPGDYSPHSLRLALRQIRSGTASIHLLGLSPFPDADQDRDMMVRSGATALADLTDLATVTDDTARVMALWQGIAVDAGQDSPPVEMHAAFIVDPENRIHSTVTYPPATGRDFAEVLRVLPEPAPHCCPTLESARHAA